MSQLLHINTLMHSTYTELLALAPYFPASTYSIKKPLTYYLQFLPTPSDHPHGHRAVSLKHRLKCLLKYSFDRITRKDRIRIGWSC